MLIPDAMGECKEKPLCIRGRHTTHRALGKDGSECTALSTKLNALPQHSGTGAPGPKVRH